MPGPDTRVVEIRVAGLVGTSGETLLDAVSTVDVAGDGLGRVIRPADRLRRPAPGPVLPALGRSIPRTLEGYLWHGMTSGGAAKATWALLFPFSLANVAFWMLPPTPPGRLPRVLGAVCRGLLRVGALLLTMLLMGQLAAIALDLFAAQCLAPGSGCLPVVPDVLRSVPARIAVGVLPLLVVIFVLHRISSATWAVHADGDLTQGPLRMRADPETPALRCLHTVAALVSVALLLLGGPFRVPGNVFDLVVWIVTLALVLATVVAAAIGVDTGRFARPGVIALAALLVVLAAVRLRPGPGPLPGTNGVVEGLGAALVAVTVLFALFLAPAALVARPGWVHKPRRLRPWLGGWAAAPVLALAGLLGGGFGAGLAEALRRLSGAELLHVPDTYLLVTVLWGAGLALAAVLAVLGFAVAVPLRRLRRGVPEIVELMEHDERQEAQAAAAWARSAWERRHLHHLALTVASAMSAGGAALLVLRFGFGLVPGWFGPLSAIGVGALGALAAGLLRVVYTAARTPQRSRHLGALADLVCFWPRAAHPTVPPCYALKVVPELAARAREHLAEPGTRVVLSGYNIGSLLTVMAAARLAAELPEADLERVGVLTAGSPLQWGYQRAFPALLPQEALERLFADLKGRWRALCRGTDIFGGGVTTWRHEVSDRCLYGVGYQPEGGSGPLKAKADENGVLILGGDHWLPDPLRGPTGRHRWAPGVLKHQDYVVDAEWDHAVAMAAGLGKPSGGEQGLLFGDFPGKP
ncbi:hypothetical protein QRX60_19405 [Amycolatopsis mongoliensis]|uniref:Integral membrane protein n=1 Tax=Amycolatopsis mongoliensis TaxID=715475 RepID=A0A9Y2NJD7_9PSEU|nr:hypothetical protein [Amycolatopsis sp. 4-36]WIY07412.1 hypothetical protein QRX60_19405 [Amycolatopsis sp. 4-36]